MRRKYSFHVSFILTLLSVPGLVINQRYQIEYVTSLKKCDVIDVDKTSEIFQLKGDSRCWATREEPCLMPNTQSKNSNFGNRPHWSCENKGFFHRDEMKLFPAPVHTDAIVGDVSLKGKLLPTDIITVWIQDESSERPHCNLGAGFFSSLHVLFGGVACEFRPSSSDLGRMSGMKYHPVMSQTAVCFLCSSVSARRAEGRSSDDAQKQRLGGVGRLEGKGRTCQGDFTLLPH